MNNDIGERAIAMLRSAGIVIAPGLTISELADVEARFSITFAPDHRAMLAAGLPLGPERAPAGEYRDWPQWRTGPDGPIRRRLAAPIEWMLPDDGGPLTWWHRSWGAEPADRYAAVAFARAAMATWPTLIPIYSHRYMPAAPTPDPAPVLSVHAGDIIFYGSNLLDYVHQEFLRPPRSATEPDRAPPAAEPLPVYPWSTLDIDTVPLE